jgi:hypothetical protein
LRQTLRKSTIFVNRSKDDRVVIGLRKPQITNAGGFPGGILMRLISLTTLSRGGREAMSLGQKITVLFFCFALLQSLAGTVADTCVSATLADYVNLGVGGCTINGLKFASFRYREDAYNGAVAIPPASIAVNPIFGATAGFDLVANWSISGLEYSYAQIAYQVTMEDPLIDHISRVDRALDNYHVEFSGRVFSDILGCDGSFGALPPLPSSAPVCDTGMYSIGFPGPSFIYADANGSIPSRTLFVTQKNPVDIRQTFSLIYDSGGTPLTSLSGVTTQFSVSDVPEPATVLMVTGFFLATVVTTRLKKT